MSQNHKAGSQNLSLIQTSRKHSKSKNPASAVESLSNFLIKKTASTEIPAKIKQSPVKNIDKSIENVEFEDSDSPYKNLIKPEAQIILNDSTSDEADFRSPVPTKKTTNCKSKLDKAIVPKIKSKGKGPVKKIQSKTGSSIKTNRKTTTSKNSTVKLITDHFTYFGENSEHMQIAIALSKSAYEAECGFTCPSPPEDLSNIGEILRSTKPTFLEKFGFTSRKPVLPVENRRVTTVSTEATKRTKNRFKYITPILNIRTDEERTSLIASKISLILCQKNPDFKKPDNQKVNSHTLNNLISKERCIFNLDNIYEENNFYVKCLDIPQNTFNCGRLLKDWKSIPGRDKSPCKKVQNVSNENDPGSNKETDDDLSSVRNYNKLIGEGKETTNKTVSSKVTSEIITIVKENSPYKISPVKHLSDAPGSSCSFDVPAESRKTLLGSFESESKDSGLTSSFASSAKSTVRSWGSCRSLSPDLFDIDNETDQQLLNKTNNIVPGMSFSSKQYTDVAKEYSSLDDINVTDCFKSSADCVNIGQAQLKYYNCIEKKDAECALPNEIIDLTEDDDEYLNESLNKNVSFNNESNSENSDCVSVQVSNQIKKTRSKRKANIYSLEEFEQDANYKIDLSTKERFEDETTNDDAVCSNYKWAIDFNKRTKNRFIDKRCNNSSFNEHKHNQKDLIITSIENDHVTKDANAVSLARDIMNSDDNWSLKCTGTPDDNGIDYCVKNTEKSNSSNESLGRSNLKDSPCLSISNETEIYGNAHKIDDSLSDSSRDLNNDNQDDIKEQSCNSLSDTPKRNRVYKRSSSIQGVDSSNESGSCDKNLILEKTPKRSIEIKGVMSPCFDEPIFRDSVDLNVTEYVNHMLNQDHFSFDNIEHVHDEFKDDGQHIGNNDEELSFSQSSQSSVIIDEELNYSSHFTTPLKVTDKAGSKHNSSYDDGNDKLENIMPLSPKLPQHVCVEADAPQNFPVVNSEIIPKTTTIKQISTPENFLIKTENVTPMPEYDKMTTPSIHKELQKVGVRPLKRTRGAKLLKYIYESTHPFIGSNKNNPESDDEERIIKKRKRSNECLRNLECNSSSLPNSSTSDSMCMATVEIGGDRVIENEKAEDLIFERKQSTKIPSCKVPLQIVWYNLVNFHPAVKENILLYEPLQLESLHVMLKEQGFKFHIQDLLTFLDKKCITIRTAQKQGKGHR